MSCIHIHLDESGDLNFKPHGTKYYIFAAAWTYDPEPLAQDLTRLRFACTKDGHDLESFHATMDKQVNRDAVVSVLTKHMSWKFAAIVVEKAKVHPSMCRVERFYPKYAIGVLRFILDWKLVIETSKVLVYTDRLPIKKNKSAVEKTIKMACRASLPTSTSFHIYHHPSESNCWLQVADYCAWALQRKWERGDVRTYSALQGRLDTTELSPMRFRTHYYY